MKTGGGSTNPIAASTSNYSRSLTEKMQKLKATDYAKKNASSLDITSPRSLLTDVNLKLLLNSTTFGWLPTTYQRHLKALLPQCDQEPSTTFRKLPSDALTNEYFSKACVDWRTKLKKGECSSQKLLKSLPIVSPPPSPAKSSPSPLKPPLGTLFDGGSTNDTDISGLQLESVAISLTSSVQHSPIKPNPLCRYPRKAAKKGFVPVSRVPASKTSLVSTRKPGYQKTGYLKASNNYVTNKNRYRVPADYENDVEVDDNDYWDYDKSTDNYHSIDVGQYSTLNSHLDSTFTNSIINVPDKNLQKSLKVPPPIVTPESRRRYSEKSQYMSCLKASASKSNYELETQYSNIMTSNVKTKSSSANLLHLDDVDVDVDVVGHWDHLGCHEQNQYGTIVTNSLASLYYTIYTPVIDQHAYCLQSPTSSNSQQENISLGNSINCGNSKQVAENSSYDCMGNSSTLFNNLPLIVMDDEIPEAWGMEETVEEVCEIIDTNSVQNSSIVSPYNRNSCSQVLGNPAQYNQVLPAPIQYFNDESVIESEVLVCDDDGDLIVNNSYDCSGSLYRSIVDQTSQRLPASVAQFNGLKVSLDGNGYRLLPASVGLQSGGGNSQSWLQSSLRGRGNVSNNISVNRNIAIKNLARDGVRGGCGMGSVTFGEAFRKPGCDVTADNIIEIYDDANNVEISDYVEEIGREQFCAGAGMDVVDMSGVDVVVKEEEIECEEIKQEESWMDSYGGMNVMEDRDNVKPLNFKFSDYKLSRSSGKLFIDTGQYSESNIQNNFEFHSYFSRASKPVGRLKGKSGKYRCCSQAAVRQDVKSNVDGLLTLGVQSLVKGTRSRPARKDDLSPNKGLVSSVGPVSIVLEDGKGLSDSDVVSRSVKSVSLGVKGETVSGTCKLDGGLKALKVSESLIKSKDKSRVIGVGKVWNGSNEHVNNASSNSCNNNNNFNVDLNSCSSIESSVDVDICTVGNETVDNLVNSDVLPTSDIAELPSSRKIKMSNKCSRPRLNLCKVDCKSYCQINDSDRSLCSATFINSSPNIKNNVQDLEQCRVATSESGKCLEMKSSSSANFYNDCRVILSNCCHDASKKKCRVNEKNCVTSRNIGSVVNCCHSTSKITYRNDADCSITSPNSSDSMSSDIESSESAMSDLTSSNSSSISCSKTNCNSKYESLSRKTCCIDSCNNKDNSGLDNLKSCGVKLVRINRHMLPSNSSKVGFKRKTSAAPFKIIKITVPRRQTLLIGESIGSGVVCEGLNMNQPDTRTMNKCEIRDEIMEDECDRWKHDGTTRIIGLAVSRSEDSAFSETESELSDRMTELNDVPSKHQDELGCEMHCTSVEKTVSKSGEPTINPLRNGVISDAVNLILLNGDAVKPIGNDIVDSVKPLQNADRTALPLYKGAGDSVKPGIPNADNAVSPLLNADSARLLGSGPSGDTDCGERCSESGVLSVLVDGHKITLQRNRVNIGTGDSSAGQIVFRA